MQRWRGLGRVPAGWGRSVVTVGVFDGVHLGHQQTIGHAVKRAGEMGVPAVVVTFDPHPSEVVRPGTHPAVLTGPERKAELIERLGVAALWVIPFTVEFSRLPADGFVHDVLVDALHASAVVVGENFRFGHRATGDVDLLRRLGRTFGFGVESPPLVTSGASAGVAERSPRSSAPARIDTGDTIFSSTYVRALVAAGEMRAAATALGRAHRIDGVVVRGDRRGRELGFPTANLLAGPHTAVPADGVYAGWFTRPNDEPRMAAVSVGTNPTFSGQERRVEAFVLDFDGDLYGERVALDFVERLREQRTYTGTEPLIVQIHEDVDRARALLGGTGTVEASAG